MLRELVDQGFGKDRGFHCAEIILGGANEGYHLGLPEDCLKLADGFGGGIYSECVCGALLAAVMVLGKAFVGNYANEDPLFKEIVLDCICTFQDQLGDIYCGPLKAKHRTPELKCHFINVQTAGIVDQIIEKYRRDLKIGFPVCQNKV